jgi:ubiquinone/menaquinone biosynthesis C-methylase UbiE
MKKLVGEFITEALAIFPEFNCGLEINCGDGLRVSAARKENFNLWGLNPTTNLLWLRLNVDPFIKIGNVYDIPYPDNFFDLVLYREDLSNLGEDNIDQAMKEVIRVSNDKIILKASLEDKPVGAWIDYLIQCGLYPEVVLENIGNLLSMEVRKNWL